jgi:hypothetical protein
MQSPAGREMAGEGPTRITGGARMMERKKQLIVISRTDKLFNSKT